MIIVLVDTSLMTMQNFKIHLTVGTKITLLTLSSHTIITLNLNIVCMGKKNYKADRHIYLIVGIVVLKSTNHLLD